MKKLITPLILLYAATASAALPLKIYSGQTDTVTTPKHIIVAVTEPGATATINGNAVKVYKTGSFGGEIALQPGANTVTVTASKDGKTEKRSFSVYRAEPVKKQTKADDSYAGEQTTPLENPRYIVTTKGAYLQFGNGDDRLGGSKMGFLDEGIRLKADGVKGSLYRVALANNHFAYIPKQYTAPAESANPIFNTGSWSIINMGDRDRISIALPARLAYRYRTNLDPSTITVDLYGATDNSNWMTQRTLELGMIDYVDFDQIDSDVYRVIIHLKDRYNWGFSVGYEGNSLTIDVRHRPAKLSIDGLVIGLDAGHGGEFTGAVSPSGLKEKDLNLDIVLKLRDMLEHAGAKVVLTRDGDTGPSMAERKEIWKKGGIQLAVSIHNNAGGSPLTSPGTAALFKHIFDRPLAEAIASRMLQLDVPFFGLVGNFNFSLNGPTDYPNMLVEGLFMSSLAEEELLADPDFRTRMARQVYLGIEDYLKTVKASLKDK
ncbi:MAG: N-acetylmuramoyl-L-alanine amidase [Muribaculaceae bacterium]